MSWSEEYSDDDNSSDYSDNNCSSDNSNELRINEKTDKYQTDDRIKKSEKTIDTLRTYAWHRGLNLFMSNHCLQDIIPFV